MRTSLLASRPWCARLTYAKHPPIQQPSETGGVFGLDAARAAGQNLYVDIIARKASIRAIFRLKSCIENG
jgi:hypothetical protein